jgi:ubiquinone/menaquinone biosynthesis C-methylase UbiE
MRIQEIRRTYDNRAEAYDRTVGLGERLAVGDFRRKFGAELRGETLEVAIGSGLNLPYYTPAVTRATGVDLSSGMLAQARNRADALGRRIHLVQGDAQRLMFASGSFDTVAISLALCTVPDPARALAELARVCRRGGRVVFLEHVLSPVPPVALLERLVSPVQERILGCHLDRATLDLAREAGFVVEREEARLLGVFRLAVARPPAL